MRVTNEGNTIYPIECAIRSAIPKESKCKDCVNLGDLCTSKNRSFDMLKKSDSPLKYSVVVWCDGHEVVIADDFEEVTN